MKTVIKLQGGLGNQLFQYAFGLAISKKNHSELYFDNSEYLCKDPYRKLDLDKYNTNLQYLTPKYKKNLLKKILRECLIFKSLKKNYNVYEEQTFRNYKKINETVYFIFNKEFLQQNTDIYVDGYFQNINYFCDVRQDLLNNLCLKETLDEPCVKLLNKIKNTNSVSIHVRRGDYINNPGFNTLPLQYYYDGIEYISKMVSNPVYFIFSDDVNWVKDNLKFPNQEVVYIDYKNPCYVDLELMSNCKHNIIANSSFSWWGAWLNKNSEKLVIMPNPWLKRDNTDIYMEGDKDWYSITY